MSTLPQTHHLVKRKGGWYYRRRVPKPARETLGKDVDQYSKVTRDLSVARKRRTLHDLDWDKRFEEIANGADPCDDAAPSTSVTAGALRQSLRDYVTRTDKAASERLLRDPPESEDQRLQMEIDKNWLIQDLTTPENPNAHQVVTPVGDRILEERGCEIADDGERAKFYGFVQRCLIELAKRQEARLKNDHSRTFFDAEFDPGRPRQLTFGELVAQHLEMKKTDSEANRRRSGWIEEVQASLAVIRELIGPDTPVADIDFDACVRVRDRIAKMPANRTKKYPGLSIDAAIAAAEKDGSAPIKHLTQDSYVRTLKDLCHLAFLKRLIPNNPAETLKPLQKDPVALGDKRRPFSQEQIRSIFTSEFYRSCAPDAAMPYSRPDKEWRFWLPLLSALQGMRPGEICQLTVGDIRHTDKGTPFIDVAETDGEDGQTKTVKTAASRRRIPLHRELEKIGFLNFVETRRKAVGETGWLFDNLKPNKHGDRSAYALRRFNEAFLPRAITVGERQAFYSIRHSFRDALRRCEAPESALKALGGWTEAKAVSDHYGDPYDPDHQKTWIAKVEYGGLDLSFLHGAY